MDTLGNLTQQLAEVHPEPGCCIRATLLGGLQKMPFTNCPTNPREIQESS